MNDLHLPYLRTINQQLVGPIKQAVSHDMTGHLLLCLHGLLSSLIAEQETGGNPSDLTGASSDTLEATSRLNGLELEQHYWRDIEQRVRQLNTPDNDQADREVEPMSPGEQQRLIALLRERCDETAELGITEVRAVSGGYSKQTIILTLSGSRNLPGQIVVRRDRAESPVGSTVMDEFELLGTLHAAGLRVPRPFVVDAHEVMGCPILIMAMVAGGNIGDVYNIHAPASVSPELARDLARELAKLHRIPLSQVPAGLPGSDSSHRDFMRQELQTFQHDWLALGETSLTISLAFEWLFDHLDQLGEQRCLVHRDTRFHNILSQGERITAILDWELAAIGHPARDLGYAYHHITQFADGQDFLNAYAEAGGSPPSELEMDFYTLWADLFVAIYMYRARTSFLRGDTDNIQIAYAGERLRQHNMHLLSTRLHELLHR